MNLDLHEILPEEISDAEAARLADIFMKLALAVESHYYPQIIRHIRALSAASEEPILEGRHRLQGIPRLPEGAMEPYRSSKLPQTRNQKKSVSLPFFFCSESYAFFPTEERALP
jgi:hypothetical protein